MAPQGGRTTASLSQKLLAEPHRFEFFQAVRLLQRLWADRAPVGGMHHPNDEFVRFSSAVDLSFPRADVASIQPPTAGKDAPQLTVSFLGVASPASFGSLPERYAEEILDQTRHKQFELREFLDLFNHRLISLFYRAWEKYRFAVAYEAARDGSFFERALFAVLGLATPGLRNRLALDDRALLSRVGLLAMGPVPASVLERLLESYFGVPARVEQFRARWFPIEQDDLLRLGAANSRLGDDAVIGTRIRLPQAEFEIRLGPMGWDDYQALLPVAAGFRALLDLARLATSEEFRFSVRLVLAARDVPELRLSSAPEIPCRLGWSTWIKTEAFQRDADDAVLSSELDLSQLDSPAPQPHAHAMEIQP